MTRKFRRQLASTLKSHHGQQQKEYSVALAHACQFSPGSNSTKKLESVKKMAQKQQVVVNYLCAFCDNPDLFEDCRTDLDSVILRKQLCRASGIKGMNYAALCFIELLYEFGAVNFENPNQPLLNVTVERAYKLDIKVPYLMTQEMATIIEKYADYMETQLDGEVELADFLMQAATEGLSGSPSSRRPASVLQKLSTFVGFPSTFRTSAYRYCKIDYRKFVRIFHLQIMEADEAAWKNFYRVLGTYGMKRLCEMYRTILGNPDEYIKLNPCIDLVVHGFPEGDTAHIGFGTSSFARVLDVCGGNTTTEPRMPKAEKRLFVQEDPTDAQADESCFNNPPFSMM